MNEETTNTIYNKKLKELTSIEEKTMIPKKKT
jgi:hypothetical protein